MIVGDQAAFEFRIMPNLTITARVQVKFGRNIWGTTFNTSKTTSADTSAKHFRQTCPPSTYAQKQLIATKALPPNTSAEHFHTNTSEQQKHVYFPALEPVRCLSSFGKFD